MLDVPSYFIALLMCFVSVYFQFYYVSDISDNILFSYDKKRSTEPAVTRCLVMSVISLLYHNSSKPQDMPSLLSIIPRLFNTNCSNIKGHPMSWHSGGSSLVSQGARKWVISLSHGFLPRPKDGGKSQGVTCVL